ncbi:MAG: YicC/YloC family endoribonuclease [Sporomusaceae bacterium]|nr:YicC/YloC family endoribonuclease [Sporomusaceae bacterium]
MTGFGRGEFMDNHHRFTVEIKAVNHRYNEIVIRMPKNLNVLEDKIRRRVAGALSRGRIDIYITLDEYGEKKRCLRVDKELAIAYHKALRELAGFLELPADISVRQIAAYPDVLKTEDVVEDAEQLWTKLAAALDIAIDNLLNMRLREGENIEHDLSRRLGIIVGHAATIGERAPAIIAEYHERLLTRLRETLALLGSQPEEARVLQEAACFAERTNFTEELVRLNSHFDQFARIIASGGAVGRKLDFLLQEINRETNTIASKANDLTVANLVVEMKSELEKIREQIQNIE